MKLALFDLDHTLIADDSGANWLRFLVSREIVPEQFMARYLDHCHAYVAGRVDLRQLNREYYELLRAHSIEALSVLRNEWRDACKSGISQAARDLVNSHRSAGDLCALVTATSEFIAAAFRDIFGFEHLVSTHIGIVETAAGRFLSGEVEGRLNYREGKIANVQDWLHARGLDWTSFDETVFYSDSFNDLPLLEHVSQPIAVTPDARLRAVALERGWPILDLS